MVEIDLMQGDCMEILGDIPDKSIDMVCCDMPYGTTRCKWDSTLCLDTLWEHYGRICKDSSVIALFAQTPFDKVLGSSKIDWLRYEIIWEKPVATGFLNAKKMPLKAHENILIFYRSSPKYNPQMTHGHERKTANREGVGSEIYGEAIKKTHYDSTSRYPRSVQKVSKGSASKGLHPTQKPVKLIEWLIKTYTDAGDTVLDNCMGSGTTGVACKNTRRNFLGIELDSNYYQTAVQRISNTKNPKGGAI